MTQRELKEKYKVFLEEYWQDEKMVKHCMGEVSYIVELTDGSILPLRKPKLETTFCFGYGYCGVSDEEDQAGAVRMSEHARTNEDYFREKNMEEINDRIKAITEDYIVVFTHYQYYSQTNRDLLTYSIFKEYTLEHNLELERLGGCKQISAEDVQRIKDGLEEVKKLCAKRIDTYLKRYGLSKVRTWAYLQD